MTDISVIIPSYRAAGTIARALSSLECFPGSEVIVVEDGACDDTAEIVARFDARLMTLDTNQGAPKARNAGFAASSGSYVIFLDADDYISADLLPALLDAARNNQADIAFGPAAEELHDHRDNFRNPRFGSVEEAIIAMSDPTQWVPPCSVLWQAQFLRSIGGWDESMARHQDIELLFRGLASAHSVASTNKGLGVYCRDTRATGITSRRGPEYSASMIRCLDRYPLERLTHGSMRDAAKRNLAAIYYRYAASAYAEGHREQGDNAIAKARSLGLRGHLGTYKHRFAAMLLGLKRKERWFTVLRASRRG